MDAVGPLPGSLSTTRTTMRSCLPTRLDRLRVRQGTSASVPGTKGSWARPSGDRHDLRETVPAVFQSHGAPASVVAAAAEAGRCSLRAAVRSQVHPSVPEQLPTPLAGSSSNNLSTGLPKPVHVGTFFDPRSIGGRRRVAFSGGAA